MKYGLAEEEELRATRGRFDDQSYDVSQPASENYRPQENFNFENHQPSLGGNQKTFESAESATEHFEKFLAGLKSKQNAPVQAPVEKPPKEYDYLDFEENERKLQELKEKELARFKNLLS